MTGRIFIFILLITLSASVAGQKDTAGLRHDSLSKKSFILHEVNRNGVKMPEFEIREVEIHAKPSREQRREFRQYDRMVSNIKRVYPYALIVRAKLSEINEHLKSVQGERDRKKYLKDLNS